MGPNSYAGVWTGGLAALAKRISEGVSDPPTAPLRTDRTGRTKSAAARVPDSFAQQLALGG
jgi:hypothetical protein